MSYFLYLSSCLLRATGDWGMESDRSDTEGPDCPNSKLKEEIKGEERGKGTKPRIRAVRLTGLRSVHLIYLQLEKLSPSLSPL